MTVSAQQIVDSACKLLGAPFRAWEGEPFVVPMWLNEGYGITPETLPPVSYFMPQEQGGQGYGILCFDLINYALIDNGLGMIGGTANIADALVNPSVFDPNTPGQPGAVAVSPDEPGVGGGRAVLYVGEHQLIQVIPQTGVTDQWTAQQTYSWGGDSVFTNYGLLPGVEYPA